MIYDSWEFWVGIAIGLAFFWIVVGFILMCIKLFGWSE